ncbi:MAG: hypothetical protein ORN98_09375 [Alphaproteobacteria bacterium]|nr:hypothetical protein [Alphaproteobacteria bacterium]
MPKIILQDLLKADHYKINEAKLIQRHGGEFVERLNQITELIAQLKPLPPECNLRHAPIKYHILNSPQSELFICNITKDILLYIDYSFKIKGGDVHLEIHLINIGDKDMLYM